MKFEEKNNVPEGFRDIVLEEAIKRRKMEYKIERFFLDKGFKPVIPPAVEFSSVFLKGMGENGFFNLLQFFDEKGQLLSLMADPTCSVARMVCTSLAESSLPIKLFYISNVFRKVRAGKGKLIETTQAGAEIVGDSGLSAEIEILTLIFEVIKSFCKDNFHIVLSHTLFLEGIFDELRLSEENRKYAMKILSTRKKLEWLEFIKKQGAREGVIFEKLLDMIGDVKILDKAEEITKNRASLEAISHLKLLFKEFKGWEQFFIFDLAKLKNFDYYTGTIFSIISNRYGYPLGNGGRYDNLIRKFGRDLPAVGSSLNIDILMEIL